MSTVDDVADVIEEYGEAIRGGWSELDGRTVRNHLEFLAEQVRDPLFTVADLRQTVGICLRGNGHWTEYCDSYYSDCKEDN